MAHTLRVGIIGANARSGWARDAHVPAVQGVELSWVVPPKPAGALSVIPCHRVGRLKARATERRIRPGGRGRGRLTTSLGRAN